MDQIKLIRKRQILRSNAYIILFSIMLLISIQLQNKHALALTILIFSLPNFIAEQFFKKTFSWPHSTKKPLWMWAVIPVVIIITYLTDALMYVLTGYSIAFLFSISLVAENHTMLQNMHDVDTNTGLASYAKKLARTYSAFGILLYLGVTTLFRYIS